MEATQVKPSTNGVIKIARRGRVKFEFEDGEAFELDVIAAHDEMVGVDWSFRDEKGTIPKEKWNEWNQTMHNFFQATVNDAYAKAGIERGAPELSRGETDALKKMLEAEVKKLNDFFLPKKDEPLSSPESSVEARINFSQ